MSWKQIFQIVDMAQSLTATTKLIREFDTEDQAKEYVLTTEPEKQTTWLIIPGYKFTPAKS